ncbi:beta-soluble NSF attachment protein isoform X1 [Monodon monoceros]|uniref:NSF attachment protein beta n=1 Tax=Monodon monoceros TaxID=40151 RepID=A0A8C6F8W4_MONMO|nr:beta-soluble NSF attachment protein isoform X1 [Monodon monoceros]
MDNAGKEREAVQLMAEAEKRVKASHSFLRGLFGGNTRIEEACEMYTRAANMFKMAKNWSAAGNAFCQAAKLHMQLQSKHDSATSFVDAGNAYKKADPQGKVHDRGQAPHHHRGDLRDGAGGHREGVWTGEAAGRDPRRHCSGLVRAEGCARRQGHVETSGWGGRESPASSPGCLPPTGDGVDVKPSAVGSRRKSGRSGLHCLGRTLSSQRSPFTPCLLLALDRCHSCLSSSPVSPLPSASGARPPLGSLPPTLGRFLLSPWGWALVRSHCACSRAPVCAHAASQLEVSRVCWQLAILVCRRSGCFSAVSNLAGGLLRPTDWPLTQHLSGSPLPRPPLLSCFPCSSHPDLC